LPGYASSPALLAYHYPALGDVLLIGYPFG